MEKKRKINRQIAWSFASLLLFGAGLIFLSVYPSKPVKKEYDPEAYLSSSPLCSGKTSLKFEDLPPAQILAKIGNSHWKTSTLSDSAQLYFDQGINALHAFWDVEAFKAFKKGLSFDEENALMHWGLFKSISQTAGELKELKAASMAKALLYAKRAEGYERDFILAQNERSTNGLAAYKTQMEDYLKVYPEQIEAKLFYASSLSTSVRSYSPDGVPTPENIRGQKILAEVLALHPNSSAANHYWIHALENGPTPEKALSAAKRIAQLAPSSGHLTHMPGHIYYRIGDYDAAIASFYYSLSVDSSYMVAFNMDPINNWNYTHNIDYLVASCAENGQYEEGLKWANLLSKISIDRSRSMTGGSGYILFGAFTAIPRFNIRFEEWEKAYLSIDSLIKQIPWNNSRAIKYLEGIRHYAKGMHRLFLGETGKAGESLIRLTSIQENLVKNRPEIAADWYYRYAVKILDVNRQELAALINYKRGEVDSAITQLKKASREEKNIGYWEPPHYTRPVYETLAWVYAQEGEWPLAKEAYQQALKLRPKNGHTQFALAKTMETLGDEPSNTLKQYQYFLDYWQNADDHDGRITYAKNYIKNH